MKKLLNTLYVTTPETYVALDGEAVVVLKESEVLLRVPLHNLEAIVAFGYTGASPALMGACAERKIALSFMKGSGRFLASVVGEVQGNVVLRRTQYRCADVESDCVKIARNFLIGKLHNARWVLERATRDHAMRVDVERLKATSALLANSTRTLLEAQLLDSLRGIEGDAAAQYFSVFDELILRNKENFFFKTRTRRPPLDRINALLSFAYSLLASEAASALSAVGLDPFVGFLHRDRPGRRSLALDLIEELRPVFADRFVLSLVNNQQVHEGDFLVKESGAVLLRDESRKEFLTAWQTKKQEVITHPFLNEKIEWGLVPHVQALLLARYLREDLDEYPPFLWK
jgi:CRISPR-associated protein Cas1